MKKIIRRCLCRLSSTALLVMLNNSYILFFFFFMISTKFWNFLFTVFQWWICLAFFENKIKFDFICESDHISLYNGIGLIILGIIPDWLLTCSLFGIYRYQVGWMWKSKLCQTLWQETPRSRQSGRFLGQSLARLIYTPQMEFP